MFGKVLLGLCALVLAINALPFNDQVVLANSLVVGRNEDLQLWICATCDESNKPLHAHNVVNKKTEIKSIVSVYPDYIVLAFRYTANLLNVWQDLLYPFQQHDDNTDAKCRVQKTYNKMWNGIRDNVTKDLIAIRNETGVNKLYITGISLGGALACLSFIDLHHDHVFDSIKVVTFGAPRVGNKRWAKFFNALTNTESRRYLIKGDPISVLPECITFFCNYRHTGIKIVCNKKKNICTQEKQIDDANIFERLSDTFEQAADIKNEIQEYKETEQVGGIIDHIYGYKKIHSYTLIINGKTISE